jgi:bifunctional UDP-N-acetylglucosamine pyrophosphorylase/glucosamine-1-phosphate N-acetyltransferase
MAQQHVETTSIVFAAGKGTRMTGYGGNKTLLPLVAGKSRFEGERPLLREVLDNLPPGPKGVVVHHLADEVRKSVQAPDVDFIFQEETNGTGGALLSARTVIESVRTGNIIITMGDVPLIRPATYLKLLEMLERRPMALLGFEPRDRARYGMLEIDGGRVARIVEWEYWKDYLPEKQARLQYCNAGVYAARRPVLLEYMAELERLPHKVRKIRDGKETTIKEYFLTDLVEMMYARGLDVGMIAVPEQEVIGVDTPESLETVQRLYAQIAGRD